ncbi:hypothetical protein BC830DRAFT_1165419 [Chytriomyces sp. MP71]|nr:hypothetical protein BC830DRAFT_1165419 [Chytriomyces sp. MP71]
MSSPSGNTPQSQKVREDRIRELEAILNQKPGISDQRNESSAAKAQKTEKPPLHTELFSGTVDSRQQHQQQQPNGPFPRNLTLSHQLSQLAREISALDSEQTSDDVIQMNSDAYYGKRPLSVQGRSQSEKESPSKSKNGQLVHQSSTVSGATWVPLVSKDFKGKPKNALPATDKTLLQILEEERSKYSALEQTYHALLAEVKSLQTSHIHEIKATDKRAEAAVKGAQKQLLDKSEELLAAQGDLKRLGARLENVEKSRAAEAERAEFQVMRIGAAKRDVDAKVVVLEKVVEELKSRKNEVEERLNKREAEMKKLILMYKDREMELGQERDTRMRSELQVLKLEQVVESKDGEAKLLKEQLRVKSIAADEGVKLKEALAGTCREVEQLSQRENMYLAELDAASQRERDLFGKLDELNAVYQKSMADCDRATSRDLAKTRELEIVKASESKLKSELSNAYQSNRQQIQNIVELEKELRVTIQEKGSLGDDVGELRNIASDLTSQLKFKNEEINNFRDLEMQLRRDAQTLKTDLFATQDDFATIQSQLMEVSKRLDIEIQAKGEFKDRLTHATEKLHETQRMLASTQGQLEALQQTEKGLRGTLQQKDGSLEDQIRYTKDVERKNQELRDVLARDEMVIETLKQKRKEDMTTLQEKYLAARQVMEQDVITLQNQLNRQAGQSNSLAEEGQRMASEISHLTQEKFKLEMKLSELSAAESNNGRTIASLQQQLRIREQEMGVLTIKLQSAIEQNRLLEEENQSHKTFNMRKEDEFNRIQTNVSEMNRKLREQVGAYMQRAESNSSIPLSPQVPSRTISRKNTLPSTGPSHTPALLRDSQMRESESLVKTPSHRSIMGIDDLESDLNQFLSMRSEKVQGISGGGGHSFLQRPADGILATDLLKK